MMGKRVLYLALALALVTGAVACSETPVPQDEPENQEPEEVVLSPEDAFDIAVKWLREEYRTIVPEEGTAWTSEEMPVIGPGGDPLVGAAKMHIYSDEWDAMVYWAVVAPQYLEYVIVLKNPLKGWRWTGSVTGIEGEVIEEEPLAEVSMRSSEVLAGTFVTNSPTFLFDGIPDTLELTDKAQARCPYCWVFTFEFDSAAAGYGDRTGQELAQVITHHVAVVTAETGDVTSAILDGKWNMLQQKML